MATVVLARDVVAGNALRAVPEGNRRLVTARVTFSNPYVVGGEVVTAAKLGLTFIDAAVAGSSFVVAGGNTGGKPVAVIPQANGDIKLKLYTAIGTEATAVDMSAETVELIAVGI